MTENRWDQIASEEDDSGNTENRKNHVVVVLDRSSSMSSIRQSAIDSFNEQIQTIREKTQNEPIDVFVSLVTFSNTVDEPTFWNTPLSDVQQLTLEDYVPNGMTAMRDGVGYAITRLSQMEGIEDENTSVLVFVISDGHENQSTEFTSQGLADLITEKQNTQKWTFVYEGANQDLTEVSANTSIAKGNTMAFTASAGGMARTSMLRSRSLGAYYGTVTSGEASAVDDFYNSTEDTPDVQTETTTGDSSK